MNPSWKSRVQRLCYDDWDLGPLRTRRVVEEIEFLIATDQLSELALAGVLSTVGMSDPSAGAAARSIRETLGDTARAH